MYSDKKDSFILTFPFSPQHFTNNQHINIQKIEDKKAHLLFGTFLLHLQTKSYVYA